MGISVSADIAKLKCPLKKKAGRRGVRPSGPCAQGESRVAYSDWLGPKKIPGASFIFLRPHGSGTRTPDCIHCGSEGFEEVGNFATRALRVIDGYLR